MGPPLKRRRQQSNRQPFWRMEDKMDQPVLSDKNQYPADEVIFTHLGRSGDLWTSFFKALDEERADFSREWRYYNDGKSWLMKVQYKKKTVFWLSLIPGSFRITFYFTDRAGDAVKASPIAEELKKQFLEGKKYNKIRGLTVTFRNKKDIAYARTLIELKLTIK